MSKQVLEKNIDELLNVTEICLKNKLILPALLLLFSGMDIMAWLNRLKNHGDVTRQDFINWVTEYLQPNLRIECNALDLYAARCSLLHSYISESRLSRNGNAKQIFYAWGKASSRDLQDLINYVDTYPAIAIHVDDLFSAFQAGVKLFNKTLSNNKNQANLVYKRANKFFANIQILSNN